MTKQAGKWGWTLDDIDVCEHGELADRNPAAYAVIEAALRASGKGMMAYLIFMAVRLLEMQRVLSPTGSIYLHCDLAASHYLKLLMDAVFGINNLRNEIVWCYPPKGMPPKNGFPRKHDIILFYSLADAKFRQQYTPLNDAQKAKFHKIDESGRRYKDFKGKRTYLDSSPGRVVPSWWIDIGIAAQSRIETTGYPTQKPVALLERIIKASSSDDDFVLDPFCGCATTLVAADRLGRKWAGIDLSSKAIELVNKRISDDRGMMPWGGATALVAPPDRTDIAALPHYRTHRHRLYGEQEGVCEGCDTHFPFKIMEVDHKLPKSRHGTDHPDNLQLLCSHCNRSKGDSTMAEWKARLESR